jgi:hypothetical protein
MRKEDESGEQIAFRRSYSKVLLTDDDVNLNDSMLEAESIVDESDIVLEEDTDEITFMIDPKRKCSCVKSATRSKLIERLTHDSSIDTSFRNAFLLTFPAFFDPSIMFACLEDRFRHPKTHTDLEPAQALKAVQFRYVPNQ